MKPRISTRTTGPGPASGFTLLEVALAIAIVIGMLMVVMFFYRQTTQLRHQVLERTEQVTAARQLLNRLTAELRAARLHRPLLHGLYGGSNSIQFIKTTVPSPRAWTVDDLGRSYHPESDLVQIRYDLAGPGDPTDPTEATGLARREGRPQEIMPMWDDPNATMREPPPHHFQHEFLTDKLRHMQFRYWDGYRWRGTWDAQHLPLGIEVSLGVRPVPKTQADELSAEGYPYEQFRRIIALPGGRERPLELDLKEDENR